MEIKNNIPANIEQHIAEICNIALEIIERKKGTMTTYSRNGIITKVKRKLCDFSDKGWPKEKIYREIILPYIDEMIKQKQGMLLRSKTKKNPTIYDDIIPDKESFEKEKIEVHKEIEVSKEEKIKVFEEEKKKFLEQEIVKIDQKKLGKIATRKFEEKRTLEYNTYTIRINKLKSFKKAYDQKVSSIKERCQDETKQRHPLIQSIFRCLDNVETFYDCMLKFLEVELKKKELSMVHFLKTAEFFVSETEKEIKLINKSLIIDPELWIEPEYRSWVIYYHLFLEHTNNMIRKWKLRKND